MLLKEEIKKIVSDVLECSVDTIGNNTILADLGLDSLKFVSMIVAIESKYNIEIFDSDLDFDKFKSVSVICETLKKIF